MGFGTPFGFTPQADKTVVPQKKEIPAVTAENPKPRKPRKRAVKE